MSTRYASGTMACPKRTRQRLTAMTSGSLYEVGVTLPYVISITTDAANLVGNSVRYGILRTLHIPPGMHLVGVGIIEEVKQQVLRMAKLNRLVCFCHLGLHHGM